MLFGQKWPKMDVFLQSKKNLKGVKMTKIDQNQGL
jgi:hypothetical protein